MSSTLRLPVPTFERLERSFPSALSEDGDSPSLAVVMVTSPFAGIPSTYVLDMTVDSLKLVDGLEKAPLLIVMDGVKIGDVERFKKGRITEERLVEYEKYHDNLHTKYVQPWLDYCAVSPETRASINSPPREVCILRNHDHFGFGHSVRRGLEMLRTRFALIAQHDRTFMMQFDRLPVLLKAFDDYPHIRYIGFTTSSNTCHDRVIHTNYHLNTLNSPSVKPLLAPDLALQPLVFWFDSQHLCEVERYLEIFNPLALFPEKEERATVGFNTLRDLIIRSGDFIEDRLGQAQRNLLARLASTPDITEDVLHNIFRRFGSYLVWWTDHISTQDEIAHQQESVNVRSIVAHLNGRTFKPNRMDELLTLYGSERVPTWQKAENNLTSSQTTIDSSPCSTENDASLQDLSTTFQQTSLS